MLCILGAIGSDFQTGIANGMFYYPAEFYVIQIKGFWDISFRSLEVFLFNSCLLYGQTHDTMGWRTKVIL